ncbi:putative lipid II flippase FtsW [Candidatus Gottesmanbacteria bacterium]|nr:putative lipid II flippase FtsW [Candidatus Gottesmanbacteria bacterium]
MKIKIHQQYFDWYLLFLTLFLLAFGLLMVFDSSAVTALTEFGNKFYYLRDQAKGVIIGLLGMIFAAFFDYRRYYKLSLPMLLGSLALLVMVFIPSLGVKALGAHRWISLGFFILQPSEVAKLITTIYLSAWLSKKEKNRFGAFLILLSMVVGLILLEPDLGTGIIIVSCSLIIYFISGAPLKHLVGLIPVALGGILALAISVPYRFARLATFLNLNSDPLGASYHVRQVLIALGSGGLWGLGLGKSRQKFFYLPEASTDSIFAIIAEELGFIGATALILVFVILIYRGFIIAKNAPDNFGRLLAFGITAWIALQIIINLSSMVALTPLTGIPLPFISYGGSAIVVELFAIGILLNISKQSMIKKSL